MFSDNHVFLLYIINSQKHIMLKLNIICLSIVNIFYLIYILVFVFLNIISFCLTYFVLFYFKDINNK